MANFGSSFDTIAALATAKGMGAIAMVRVSGKQAITVVDSFFVGKSPLAEVPASKACVGKFYDGTQFVDEVVATVYRAPASYTGEDLVEICMHGSSYIYGKVMECLLRKARIATAGEFTKRAFLHGKMDLTKAESVDDLIKAKTAKSHQLAVGQYQGKLFAKISQILQELSERRAELELEIDFLEQGLQQVDLAEFRQKILQIKQELQDLLSRADDGVMIKDGFRVVLIGGANAGKSSIFNALLANNRAIVTPVAGTTRDYLEEVISLDGFLVRVYDTAGLRQTDCEIEQEGISRSLELLREAHLVLSVGSPDVDFQDLPSDVDLQKVRKIFNKADLLSPEQRQQASRSGLLLSSAVEAGGLSQIRQELLARLQSAGQELESGIVSSARQKGCVSSCIQYLQKVLQTIDDDLGFEFIAFELKLASGSLEQMVGSVSSEDILHSIFANFCIGK